MRLDTASHSCATDAVQHQRELQPLAGGAQGLERHPHPLARPRAPGQRRALPSAPCSQHSVTCASCARSSMAAEHAASQHPLCCKEGRPWRSQCGPGFPTQEQSWRRGARGFDTPASMTGSTTTGAERRLDGCCCLSKGFAWFSDEEATQKLMLQRWTIAFMHASMAHVREDCDLRANLAVRGHDSRCSMTHGAGRGLVPCGSMPRLCSPPGQAASVGRHAHGAAGG